MNVVGSKRSHRTCEECRTRKVRCDGKRNICSNCERLGFDCSFRRPEARPGDLESIDRPQRALRRCRTRQACLTCHGLKARCSGHHPTCDRCREKDIRCSYPPSRGPKHAASLSSYTASQQTNTTVAPSSQPISLEDTDEPQSVPSIPVFPLTPSDHTNVASTTPQPVDLSKVLERKRVLRSLERFFTYIHPIPTCAFLHKASLLQRYNIGQVDQALLLSILALTSRLPDASDEEKEYGPRCCVLAETIVFGDLARPSILKLQALLLITKYWQLSGDFSRGFVLLATLTRFAFALRLNYENRTLCFLAQESRRRLMWAIYMVDTIYAGGLPEYTLCPSNVIHIALPVREEEFELDIETETECLQPEPTRSDSSRLGLLAYHVRMMYFRDSILRFTKEFVSSQNLTAAAPDRFHQFETTLEIFATRLPPSAIFSEKNLRLRTYSPWLPRFIMVHVWWHQCHCDLYRCLMPGLRESLPKTALQQVDPQFLADCQRKCIKHANAIADICSMILDLELESVNVDQSLAECAYQAARILLHALYKNRESVDMPEEQVYEQVAQCSGLIKTMIPAYPLTKSILADLDSLLNRGTSSASSDDESLHPTPRRSYPGSNQILSKHSLIRISGFVDDSHNLEPSLGSQKLLRSASRVSPRTNILDSQATRQTREHAHARNIPRGTDQQRIVTDGISNDSQHNSMEAPSTSFGGGTGGRDFQWWDENNAFQGAWDGPEVMFDPVAQSQVLWNSINGFTGNLEEHHEEETG